MRKKIVAIQIALFSACVDTRKNSRDLNRDSNRAFLVCGNAPNMNNNIQVGKCVDLLYQQDMNRFLKNINLMFRCILWLNNVVFDVVP